MNPKTRLALGIVAAALALGVLGDALLRAWPLGINVLVWIAALVVALGVLTERLSITLTGGGRWLLYPVIFFAAAFVWHDSLTLNFLNLLALLLSLALVAARSRAGRVRIAGVMEYVTVSATAAGQVLFGVLSLLASDIRWQDVPQVRWSGRAAAIGRGLLIGLPLLFVFGALFAAADAAFESLALSLFDWDIDQLLTHAFFVGLWGWISAGFLRQALVAQESERSADKPAPYTIGAIEIGVALGLLNALFLAFVLVQLRYFFGGADVVLSSRTLTYAEYARRGFFELVTVAGLVLPLLLVAHWLLPRDAPDAARMFRGLAGALIALLFIIMASAVQRMLLYQQQFGLTELRVYTTAFMLWLAIVFVWFVASVLRGERERFAFGALLAGFAVIVGLHVLNPDDLITRVNAGREDAPHPFDTGYVIGLSADAVPALIDALPAMTETDRCVAATRLLREWSPPQNPDWRTWNVSRVRAWQVVGANQAYLQEVACPLR